MGRIAVHEFLALDGVFEDPRWTMEFGFDPMMGETLAAITDASTAILLGRTTYEMFAPAWSTRTVEEDPGAPFFNDTHKYVVGAQEPSADWGPSPGSGRSTPTRSAGSRTRRRGTSTSPAAGRWCARCCRSGWSTSCTCSSTRSPWAAAGGCGPTAPTRPGSRCRARRLRQRGRAPVLRTRLTHGLERSGPLHECPTALVVLVGLAGGHPHEYARPRVPRREAAAVVVGSGGRRAGHLSHAQRLAPVLDGQRPSGLLGQRSPSARRARARLPVGARRGQARRAAPDDDESGSGVLGHRSSPGAPTRLAAGRASAGRACRDPGPVELVGHRSGPFSGFAARDPPLGTDRAQPASANRLNLTSAPHVIGTARESAHANCARALLPRDLKALPPDAHHSRARSARRPPHHRRVRSRVVSTGSTGREARPAGEARPVGRATGRRVAHAS